MAAGLRCGLDGGVWVSLTGFNHCIRNTDLNHRKGEDVDPPSPLPWAWPELNLSSDSNETFIYVFATLYFLVFQKAVRDIYYKGLPSDQQPRLQSFHKIIPVPQGFSSVSGLYCHLNLHFPLVSQLLAYFYLCSIPLDQVFLQTNLYFPSSLLLFRKLASVPLL